MLTSFSNYLKSSFYSPEKYQDLMDDKSGNPIKPYLVIGFLSFISAIVILTPGLYSLKEIKPGEEMVENFFASELEIKIRNGEVSTNVEEPFFIESQAIFNEENNMNSEDDPLYLLVIDTTHDLTTEEIQSYDSVAVLGKHTLYANKNKTEQRVYDLTEVENFTLNKSVVQNYIDKFSYWVPFIIALVAIMLFLFMGLFGALFYAFMALFGALIVKGVMAIKSRPIPYGTAYVIASFALIPVVIFDVITDIIRIGNSFWLGVALFCVILLININKPETPA